MTQRIHADQSRYFPFLLGDALCLFLSFFLAWTVFMPTALIDPANSFGGLAVVLLFAQLLSSQVSGSHTGIYQRGLPSEICSVATLSFCTVLLELFYLLANGMMNRPEIKALLMTLPLYFLLDIVVRSLLKKLISQLNRQSRQNAKANALLIVTDHDSAPELLSGIEKTYERSYLVKGLVYSDSDDREPLNGIPVVSDYAEASMYICRNWIDEVLIYDPQQLQNNEMLLKECVEMGVRVHTVVLKEDRDCFAENIGSFAVLTSEYTTITPFEAIIKRLIDIIGSLVGCFLTLFVGLIVGPVIYKASPGPIIFKQERIGKNGRVFKAYKFRSMYPDADARKAEYMSQNRFSDGMMFKLDFDPRIIGNEELPDGTQKTGIGEFIRKTSLDEFPQFFNVLKGEMSLVGTRPPTLDEWNKYQYHHRTRMTMKPGITGMWQVSGRSEITDFEETVRLDTSYIRNYSLWLDIKILFKTVGAVISRKGAV